MFDLESQIRRWRSDLAAAMGNLPEPLDELESHLRDDIDRRIQLGADAQSAFEAARAQLGQAKRLAQEFARTSDRRWIPGWIAIGTVAAAVLLAAIWATARASSGKVGPLLASLAGNLVGSLSWFGPGLTSGGPTFAPTSGPLLATFVLLQLVLMAWQAMRGRAAHKADS